MLNVGILGGSVAQADWSVLENYVKNKSLFNCSVKFNYRMFTHKTLTRTFLLTYCTAVALRSIPQCCIIRPVSSHSHERQAYFSFFHLFYNICLMCLYLIPGRWSEVGKVKVLEVAIDLAEIFWSRRSEDLDNFHELVSCRGARKNRLT